ncbi:MAG: ABC transporter permease subunit [Gammaproteobacteria bacterium]|nr:ABC transporter permease subunit [Gammaproteobacteria bacterium]MCY4356226.1 ABC transporter permease subunit [Gammaproteobacteria bacterium]
MIGTIIQKELTEFRRDGRAIGLLGIVGLLLLLGLMTGFANESARKQNVQKAMADDAAVFLEQGIKNPHAAAHFSRMAHKPVAPLAAFDPGVASYLGQVIWMEAHYRNPAMFRRAEDAPELSRLENFSVAGVLTLILPLLVVLVGYGSIASERERGTLRQLLGAGISLPRLLLGKFLVIAGVAFTVLFSAVLVATLFSLQTLSESGYSLFDLLLRGGSLLLGYGLYIVCLTAITLLVSTLVSSARSALLVMLGVWVVAVVGLPRLSASIAEQVYPSPDAVKFWQETRASLQANSPPPGSEDYTMLERQVVERALGRELREGELQEVAINRGALMLEVSELTGAKAYNAAFDELFANYDRQRHLRRLLSVLSPTIALQHLSRTYAGTDVSAHEHFSLAAEEQRNNIVRVLNEDMMINGVGQSFGYVASEDLWDSVPIFEYRPASVAYAWGESLVDLLVLLLWGVLAIAALFRFGSTRSVLR